MKDKTILTEEEKSKLAQEISEHAQYHLLDCEINNENSIFENELGTGCSCGLTECMVGEFDQLLAKKLEEKEKEIADQLNEIDSVDYNFWNRKDDTYPSVRIHSGKYRRYFLSKSGLGDAVKEMFNWIKSKSKQ